MIPTKKPKKSLRTLLMLWFLLFSVVPLAFITGYSVVKYEQAIDQETVQRLEGNYREIASILKDFEAELSSKLKQHTSSGSLAFYISQRQYSNARAMAKKWLENNLAHRISIFNKDGRQEIALFKDERGEVKRLQDLEGADIYLSEAFLDEVGNKESANQIEVRKSKSLDLIAFGKVLSQSGRLVGYVEEIIELDKSFLKGLNKRMNLEIVFFSAKQDKPSNPEQTPVFSSHDDLELYSPSFFLNQESEGKKNYFEMNIQSVPYGFIVRPIRWGQQEFYLALGTSKSAVKAVLKNVNLAFFSVVGGIVLLLIVLSLIISRILLKPVSDLLDAIHSAKPGDPIPEVKTVTDTELGLLAESFNELSKKVNKTQKQLKQKVVEVEGANTEIRDAQARLVHSAKMVSLGQLVAGVAHELNNPIGFIYSNMSHLREYSNNLMRLADTAISNPTKVGQVKQEIDYDYIVKDLPKLIQSCEDGAKRTRDIVLGLRNFSRLEDAKLKSINIEANLDDTLNLLSGEMKSRIKLTKNYGNVPQIKAYPSQLNQVFMNILSNASQAIKDKGEITITTRQPNKDIIEISIKDTGQGMKPGTAEQVFDPFFTTKTLGQGTGLGLSISYGIIQKHDGNITLNTKPGKGTEFIISLPIKGPLT